MLRKVDGSVEVHHDRHIEDLFTTQTWLDLLTEVGFEPTSVGDASARVVCVDKRPGDAPAA